jgi:hypothetical protein
MLAPAYFVAAITSLFWMPRSLYTAALLLPLMLSLVLPPMPSERLLQSWPFRYMPAYFDFEEVRLGKPPPRKQSQCRRRIGS